MMERHIRCRCQNVQFVPDISYNPLSGLAVSMTGRWLILDGRLCRIGKSEVSTAGGSLSNRHLTLNTISSLHRHSVDIDPVSYLEIWHKGLPHAYVKRMKAMTENGAVSNVNKKAIMIWSTLPDVYLVRALEPVHPESRMIAALQG